MDLVAAVKRRSLRRALELISEGADVNLAGPRGETALLWAVIHGDHQLVEAILAAGGHPTPRTSGKRAPGNGAARATPLHFATNPDRLAILQSLLTAGAEVEAEDAVGLTPLGAAAAVGNEKAARLLLAAGADPNHRCQPLLLASTAGHGDVVKCLLEAGGAHTPDPTATFPPLRLAIANGHAEVVTLLRAAGAVWREE